ncbi:PspC domain-containing protein [Emticicia sp. BO119]|uniref:PspC domain-containing protein n=1 Tax=Emticicia sp. BO119 TaxID=2757768 RepID=UPI0015F0FDF6|nr:PspC domain-containing protein [Emticicia sp. BO119]MBA4853692.1 PspC domain-containing protein [Emticicia sp. BO119]
MKKTIQINIAGVVFNIEEDAYDKLNNYLRSIQQYFSSYEGNQEIVSDIEARIAEKFWTKDKSEGATQVITLESVNDLIKSMGSVADFEAIQEEEDLKTSAHVKAESKSFADTGTSADANTASGNQQTTPTGPKRLYRDMKRKALGGVLAGLAHYFNMDVVWIRIIFLLIFLGVPPLIEDLAPFSGFVFLGYFVCWLVFPPSTTLTEDEKIKKFYRDNDNKVLGGVASGLAAYFGVDVTVIRLLFVLSVLLFGTGVLAYIILWIVAPKAQTLTQKMEMKGEPVTLSNIETNIKEGLKVDKSAPENAITKVLLFPFRLVAVVIKGIGEILKNLGPVARVLAGILLMLFALAMLVVVVASIAAFFGVVTGFEGSDFFERSPFRMFAGDINPTIGLFAFLAAFTPFLALLFVGLILMTNRRIGTRNFWVSLLGLWLVGLMGTGILATKYALNFQKKGKVEETKNFSLPTSTLLLDSNNNRDDFDEFEAREQVSVELEGYDGSDLKLEQRFEAQGRTRADAEKNAKNVLYDIKQKDSVLIFDQKIRLAEGARFRGQDLYMTLYIPYGKPFKLTRRFYYEIFNRWRNDNYDVNDDADKYTFVMKRDSGMVCRDCPKLSSEEREALRDRSNHYDEGGNSFDMEVFEGKGQFEKKFDVRNFSKIDVGGAFIVTVRQGDSFNVTADSDDQDNIDDLDVDVKGETLEIEYRDKFSFSRRNSRTRIIITMPKLAGLDLSGASTAKVIGFKDRNQDIDINLTGAVKAAIDVDARNIELDATGAANADFRGSADKMDIEATGACHINARKMDINQVNADATGASNIDLGRVQNLNSSHTSGASKITRE